MRKHNRSTPKPSHIDAFDLDGRSRMPLNVVFSWATQGIQIVSGFLIPRLISNELGNAQLGAWDFCWSLATYFSLAQLGVTSSINRYIALHRTRGENEKINDVASTSTFLLLLLSMMVIIASLGLSKFAPLVFSKDSGVDLDQIKSVILILGAVTAVQVATSSFSGILTGCHRWDIHNGIFAFSYTTMLFLMIAVLHCGGGLVELSLAYLTSDAAGRLLRIFFAYRVHPGLSLSKNNIRKETAAIIFRYGGKTLLPRIAQLIVNPSIALLITSSYGPVALALYARPKALIDHTSRFIQRYCLVVVPTTSAVQGANKPNKTRDFAIKVTRMGVYFSLPPLSFVMLYGGEVIRLWMGPDFYIPLLATLMAASAILNISHSPLYSILSGLDRHGRVGIAKVCGAAVSLLLAYLATQYLPWGIVGIAATSCIAPIFVSGITIPLVACRELKISLAAFYRKTWKGPMLINIPFLIILAAPKLLGKDSVHEILIYGVAPASIFIAICYWKYALPILFKKKLTKLISSIINSNRSHQENQST